jgi:hypothetical protein
MGYKVVQDRISRAEIESLQLMYIYIESTTTSISKVIVDKYNSECFTVTVLR